MYSIDSAPARINHIRDTNAPNVLSVHRLRMICVRGPWPRTNHTYDILYIYYHKMVRPKVQPTVPALVNPVHLLAV